MWQSHIFDLKAIFDFPARCFCLSGKIFCHSGKIFLPFRQDFLPFRQKEQK